MNIKTSELVGHALDWAVAKCEGYKEKDFCSDDKYFRDEDDIWYSPSTDWAQGGPIIEREEINIIKRVGRPFCGFAYRYGKNKNLHGKTKCIITSVDGPTPLIAAMRCYVANKLGNEIKIPDNLKQ